MAEVIYSLNGKYFKDYDIFISSSDGLFDGLKPKKQEVYDWAEYSGIASDINQKKRFETRKFTLTGFVKGTDWKKMIDNFWTVFGDLNKAGRHRLLIKAFGLDTLVYDVVNEDLIDIKKTFKEGNCYALFTIKLIEQKPIKKILYTDRNNLQLSFNSPKWVEVNVDGEIANYKGNVVINKTMSSRTVTGYNFQSRNILLNSNFKNSGVWFKVNPETVFNLVPEGAYVESKKANDGIARTQVFILQDNYSVSFKIKFTDISNGGTGNMLVGLEQIPNSFVNCLSFPADADGWRTVKYTKLSPFTGFSNFLILGTGGVQNFFIKEIMVVRSSVHSEWKSAPEDQHFISIAGEVDEITNLTTNAQILWEKL